MRKSKREKLETRFGVLQKAQESLDYQNFDDCLMLENEYINLLNEWSFFDYLIFSKKEDIELHDRIRYACEKHMKKFEEENEQYKEWNERMSVF